MFEERKQQETTPAQKQTKVLQEEHDNWSVGLHSIHLWKLVTEGK